MAGHLTGRLTLTTSSGACPVAVADYSPRRTANRSVIAIAPPHQIHITAVSGGGVPRADTVIAVTTRDCSGMAICVESAYRAAGKRYLSAPARRQRRDAPVIAAARGTVASIFTLAFISLKVDDGVWRPARTSAGKPLRSQN
ncbi:hypothetical protein KCP74_06765 [Salmonella enterica subsp. enterica]|nr:hypothetical protein KCP74_06765 [Salmonella enterica subsp. enterica]